MNYEGTVERLLGSAAPIYPRYSGIRFWPVPVFLSCHGVSFGQCRCSYLSAPRGGLARWGLCLLASTHAWPTCLHASVNKRAWAPHKALLPHFSRIPVGVWYYKYGLHISDPTAMG